MAISLTRPTRVGKRQYFKYKRINRITRYEPGTTTLKYAQNLHPAEYVLGAATKRIRFQPTYTSTLGCFPSIPAAAAGRSYVDTVLHRPAPARVQQCIMRGDVRLNPNHTDHSNCSPTEFYGQFDYHSSLELRETENMGIGVFATADLPQGIKLGLYTGDAKPPPVVGEEEDVSYQLNVRGPDDEYTAVLINSLQQGNWTRFLNHSCDNNCRFGFNFNCGDIAVAVVTSARPITAGEQLFLDYGQRYFRDRDDGPVVGDGCLCGFVDCHSEFGRDYDNEE